MKHEFEISYRNVHLRPLEESDIETLRNWRNDPGNSQYLSKKPRITKEMQFEWYRKYLSDKNEILFAIEENRFLNRFVGCLGLYDFSGDECFFGKLLLGDEEAHGTRVGLNATIAAVQIAISELNIKNIFLYVYPENRPARSIYEQAGFIVCGFHEDKNGKEELLMSFSAREKKEVHNMNKVQMLEFPQKGDERGHLVIVEGLKDIPFDIKRVFYIYGSEHEVIRGNHANRDSEFVLINVAGTSKVKVKDGEGNEAIYCLNRPHTGIYLPTMVWKEMYDFSEDSVLLVLASTHYDAEEYIRDYDDFKNRVNES